MKKKVLVSADRNETRVAMLEADGTPGKRTAGKSAAKDTTNWRTAELYLERRGERSIVGNVYKAKVENVVAGLEAAFVDIGFEKNGFLHVDDIVVDGKQVAKRGTGRGSRITDLLKSGQEIVVQVTKDPLKTKGARLTMQLAIPGRFMVYVPTGEGVGFSRRLDDKERVRLRREARDLDLGGGGAIIRTAARGDSVAVELRDRAADFTGGAASVAGRGVPNDPAAEAGVALQQLGYKPAEISRMLKEGAPGDSAEDIIRKALKSMLRNG